MAYIPLTNKRLETEKKSLYKYSVPVGGVKLDGDINGLIISSQPANLIKLAGKNLNAGERDVFRAETVKKALKIMAGGNN